jgi:aspartate aminotransferase-like enzyme
MPTGKAPLLMTLGPCEMEEALLILGGAPLHYSRTSEFSELWGMINTGLQYVFETAHPVYTLAASGTGAMQMAVSNICSPGDLVLVPHAGSFGRRWVDIAKAAGANVAEYPLPEGSNVNSSTVDKILEEHPCAKALFTTYNETSTGALANMEAIRVAMQGRDMLWVVDAISALAVEPLPMDVWGCDVVIVSSQKGLALPPGLAFIAFSQKAWTVVERTPCSNFYFDAKEYRKNWIRNQSPFTPAVGLLVQLDYRLNQIRQISREEYRNKYRILTEKLRSRLIDLGLEFISSNMGNCTTALNVPANVNASRVADIMRLKHGIAIGQPYPGGRSLRIGNYGNITETDIERCCACLKESIAESITR